MVDIHHEGSTPSTGLLAAAAGAAGPAKGGAAGGAPAIAQGGRQAIATIAAGAIEYSEELVGRSLPVAQPNCHLGAVQDQLRQGRPVSTQGVAAQVGPV
jgi:hypothetical protein